MNITKPIIRKIKDNETALAEFEKEIKTNEAEDTKDIIMNFPTVYIHNWPETNKENKILLFVRKNKDDKEAKEFYFLGEVFAQGEPIPIKMEKTGDDAFEINYKLDVPVREDIYEYIVSEA